MKLAKDDRDELRTKCIDAMEHACMRYKKARGTPTMTDRMTAAFDALHGIVPVVPPEATKEMIGAGISHRNQSQNGIGGTFDVMAAIGDLTNLPEGA